MPNNNQQPNGLHQKSVHSVKVQQNALDASDLRTATRTIPQNGYQICKWEHVDVTLLENAINLKGQSKNQMCLAQASKIVAEQWLNLSVEDHAFDSKTKVEKSAKFLAQIGKSLDLLTSKYLRYKIEAMGWSVIFVTFKDIKGTPAKLANIEYVNGSTGAIDSQPSDYKQYPPVAKSVEMNKSVQQGHMEHLAPLSLNGCLAEKGFKTYSTFPWSQVQSNIKIFKQALELIRLEAQKSQVLGRAVGSDGDVGDFNFLEFLNNHC
ncbi:hypothetical protein BJ741DRAFT_653184 [Chytriomyces cf. hyalinus JEL632]|nr:hypothetical protein BJ741DRAFT_653184 [Chytriomyces cf. hyalinus JEL632]